MPRQELPPRPGRAPAVTHSHIWPRSWRKPETPTFPIRPGCAFDPKGDSRQPCVRSELEALPGSRGDHLLLSPRPACAIGRQALGFPVTRIGLEAGPLSHWLYAGLTQAGFDVVLLETRHVKAALSAMVVKTDRKDARGIAQLIRMGWFRAVHAKSTSSQEIRALLTARRRLLDKLRGVELRGDSWQTDGRLARAFAVNLCAFGAPSFTTNHASVR